jgi:hypothetical protein
VIKRGPERLDKELRPEHADVGMQDTPARRRNPLSQSQRQPTSRAARA